MSAGAAPQAPQVMTRAAGADQHYVARVTRASGTNFYYAFLFLPKQQREAIHAVYAFCREVDDSVDAAPNAAEASRRLAFWRGELAACYEGAPTHPITRSLAAHVGRYPIRRRDLEEILVGVERDVEPRPFADFDELTAYCHRVASAVGLVCIEIFGYKDPRARDYAVALGLAFQMTNILRDVRADALRGRVYLPADEMARFSCPAADLRAARPTPAFTALMRFQIERTRELFAQARRVFPQGDRRSLFAAEIMGAIYEAILQKVARRDGDVLRGKVKLSKPHKLMIAAGIYLRSRAPRQA